MPETKVEISDLKVPADSVGESVVVPTAPETVAPLPRAAVSFEVWARLSGKRFDQLAGFRNHVKRGKIGPLTVLGWREAFQKFMSTPTK
jgi:hypothetical protein